MIGFLAPLIFSAYAFFAIQTRGIYMFQIVVVAILGFALIDLIWAKSDPRPVAGPRGFFNAILYSYVPVHVALIAFGAHLAATVDLALYERAGLVLSVGIVTGGIGITFAHELIHRKSRAEKLLGEILLVFVSYGHFAVAHVLGHHRNVGTHLDPVTARQGTSVYRHYFRVLPGVFREALSLKRGQTIVYTLCTLALVLGIFWQWGSSGVYFFLGQSLTAVILLETIEYIEHYGLTRNEISPGRFERVQAQHSWDTPAWFTGRLLIHLQRHSDHHLHVLKDYPSLELRPEAMQLPTGYPGMILLALVPPIWFRLMNPRLQAPRSDFAKISS